MKKSHQIILHTGLWLIFNILQYARYIALNYGNISPDFYWIISVQLLLNLLSFYGAYFIVFANIFKSSKLRSAALLVVYILINIVLRTYISRQVFLLANEETWLDKYNSYWLQTLFVLTYVGLSFLVRFTIHWFHDQQIKTELINQKQASELALLRAQVNPHFLFNTLNNIYSLALQKSPNVPESIARLSDIMRYMLGNSDVEKVPLDKEMEYLESFIELQQLRNEYIGYIDYAISGDTTNKYIAPMLLIPFIENAFKHGSKVADPPGIIIRLEVNNQALKLSVTNFIKENISGIENKKPGTGLENVKRRLDLIYKNRYQLTLGKGSNEKRFEVNLSIEL